MSTQSNVVENLELTTEESDSLDDERIHARCPACFPPRTVQPLDGYVTLCGRRRVWLANGESYGRPPAPITVCEDCERVAGTKRCPRCGESVAV